MIWPFSRKKSTKQASSGPRRAYAAATTNRLSADWNAPTSTADMELKSALRILRNRSRDLERNNDYIRRYFNLLIENVIGHKGIGLQVRAVGGDGRPDQYANRLIEGKWREWGRKGCTVCGRFTWLDAQRIILRSMARDGEVLLYFPPIWKKNSAGFAFQIIEADHLDLELNTDLGNGNKISMGVELDSFNSPVAYHILTRHPAETATRMTSKFRRRFPVENIIHLRRPERIDETRSAPWITSGANRLRQISAAEEAEVIAWRIAASKMGFYIPGDDSTYDGDDEDDSGNPIQEAEPGFFEKLKKGWDFKDWNPDKPVSTVESFLKAELRGVASGLNVSYVALANNLEGVSFSSIRSGELADRGAWRAIQSLMIEHLCQPVFERWLETSLTTGFIPLPPGKFDKFNSAVWRPRGWEWVDPSAESEAAQEDVSNCFKSIYDIAAERGVDFDDVIEANREAKAKAEAAGLIIPAFTPKEPQNGPNPKKTEQ